ncbi:MAG: exopolyphosphatase [Thermoanaerobaculia bacterium]
MLRLGIADLGSNTARLVVFVYEPGRWYRMVDGIREIVRLGEGLGAGESLVAAAIDRAAAALELFTDYAEATRLDRVEVLGTSAMRDAENRKELTRRLRGLPLTVSVLSGQEEAEMAVCAVANGFREEDAWVVDLGGGSVQVAEMRRREFVGGKAYPFGAVRTTERFLRSDPPTSSQVAALEAALEEQMGGVVRRMERQERPIIAVGGTIRNLARMAQNRGNYPLPLLHGYWLRRDDLEEIAEQLLSLRRARRVRLSGLNTDRADIITAGAVVFRWLLRESGHDRILISGHGVREGAFYRHFLEPPHRVEDVGRFSVQNLLEWGPHPPAHADHLRWLAARLFDELAPLHSLGADEARLLEVAATLHGIGSAVDYYRRDRHGAYVLTSVPLSGFTHREQALISLLVRYQRRGKPSLGAFKALAEAGDRARLRQLTACLRLADALERSRAGRVRDVHARIGDGRVTLTLDAAETPTVELWEARNHAGLFADAFGSTLELATETG